MSVNLSKYQDDLTNAWRNVVDKKDQQNWALFGYEGNTNVLKVQSIGSGGLKNLVNNFNCSQIQYAFCRVIDQDISLNKLVLINWQGDSSPLSRKGLCASHVGDVSDYLKGCTQTITIRNDDEATEEYLMDQIVKTRPSRININVAKQNIDLGNSLESKSESSYKRPEISSQIAIDRKSFWLQQEEEEKQRLLEEKQRAQEKQAQFERERKLKEESEAKKLAEKMKERDRIIEATRTAERRESSASNHSSSNQVNSLPQNGDSEERVGRRSELLRLERNQETQSLISRGSTKNKRAIFEKASTQEQIPNNLSRRSSGGMVKQRLDTFKSMDGSSSLPPTTDSRRSSGVISNEKPEINHTAIISEAVEKVKISNDESEVRNCDSSNLKSTTNNDSSKDNSLKFETFPTENGNVNLNNNHITVQKSTDELKAFKKLADELVNEISSDENDLRKAKAVAIYDYQAADPTEISFDPNDLIGFIEKVDEGWWHGQLISGRYYQQTGLFPSNYVVELQ